MDVSISNEDALKIAKILGVAPTHQRKVVLTPLEVTRLVEFSKLHPGKAIRIWSKHSGIGFNTYVSVVDSRNQERVGFEITDYNAW